MGNTDSAAIRERVAAIWRDVLGGPADATFFDLGGQSMSAIRIVARIEEELGVDVEVTELFEDPDLETFTRAVVAAADAGSDRQRRAS